MQKITKHTLENGLSVVFINDMRFTTSSVRMVFDIGWRHDPDEQLGLAHFFEHLVGKRTRNYPEKGDLAKELSLAGIQSNANTAPSMTTYLHEQLNEQTIDSLSLLLESIYYSHFNSHDLEIEKAIVINEGHQHKDTPATWANHIARFNLYPQSSLARFFFGDETTLSRISVETFDAFYQHFRNPANATLYIASNDATRQPQALSLLQNFFTACDTTTNFCLPPIIETFLLPVIPTAQHQQVGKQQANITIAYRCDPLSSKEQSTLLLLRAILLYGLSAKLYVPLRDQLGIIYSMQMSFIHYRDTSTIYFTTTCKREDVQKLIDAFNSNIKTISEAFTQRDIDNIENLVAFDFMSTLTPGSSITSTSIVMATTQQLLTAEEFLKLRQAVLPADLKMLCSRIFNINMQTVAIIS
jgi:predicted Zn-dependent peptidase